jgi:hypothetical protein
MSDQQTINKPDKPGVQAAAANVRLCAVKQGGAPMAKVVPFPRSAVRVDHADCARFRPEARSALAALGYALSGVAVQFCTDAEGGEWAVIGSTAHAAIWFSVYPVGTGELVLRDARLRFVGRYRTGARLRATLQPLARNLAHLCALPETSAR